jgi:hypothetical protein
MTGKEETEKEPKLKPKDEKDIKEILANTEQLLNLFVTTYKSFYIPIRYP